MEFSMDPKNSAIFNHKLHINGHQHIISFHLQHQYLPLVTQTVRVLAMVAEIFVSNKLKTSTKYLMYPSYVVATTLLRVFKSFE